MEVSLPGSVGAARKAVGQGKVYRAEKTWRTGCRFGDRRQRSVYDVCTMYVHGRVAPGDVAQSSRALARTLSDKPLATE